MIINDYLRDSNITKYRFSKNCGLPYGTVNDICTGKTDIARCTGETLLKIARTIGCTVEDLLGERPDMPGYDLAGIKKLITPIAEKYRLNGVYVFGSYARNEASENSDVDIVIDREGSEIHGLFGMNALLGELEEALKKEVDLVTLQSLQQSGTNAGFTENVIKEMVKIYG